MQSVRLGGGAFGFAFPKNRFILDSREETQTLRGKLETEAEALPAQLPAPPSASAVCPLEFLDPFSGFSVGASGEGAQSSGESREGASRGRGLVRVGGAPADGVGLERLSRAGRGGSVGGVADRPGRGPAGARVGRPEATVGSSAGRVTGAGLAEHGGAPRPRGDPGRLGRRRRAPPPAREPCRSESSAIRGPRCPQRPSVRSAAGGHDRPARGAAAGARQPRVKKKARPHSTRSGKAARAAGMALAAQVAPATEVTRAEAAAPTQDMAAAGLSVTVTHGSEKQDLHVTAQQGRTEPTVQDLAQAVEEARGVPLPFQKLIFKGKSLKEMEMPLSALGIQNGCRVMLIGEKGFLAKDLQAEALCKLDRRVKATIEQFMKILEEIDAMILPENFKDSRLKRKGLVKKVQAFLAECDTVEENICQETARLQSTNLALAE
ncbi:PREDICTED: BAG family molecular chaperone regulator 1 isoform X2 [Chinchilla lanigera]|uniref:BAG family molecular chaperone regulator 1 isoform X2 n=1 Tax=Chinchilla lanigera TaxID=34839 RepID=UPI000698907C|nr:PREDICTED: BAG family molecular chaperone regulator 1 isoform X2 [Chinchilla lanigera]